LYESTLKDCYDFFLRSSLGRVRALESSLPDLLAGEVRAELGKPVILLNLRELLFYNSELNRLKDFYDEVMTYFDENESLSYVLDDFKKEFPNFPEWPLKVYELFYDALINENEGICIDDYLFKR